MASDRVVPFRCRRGAHAWREGTLSTGECVKRCSYCLKTTYICPAHPFGPGSAVFVPEQIDRCTCPITDPTFPPDDKIGVA